MHKYDDETHKKLVGSWELRNTWSFTENNDKTSILRSVQKNNKPAQIFTKEKPYFEVFEAPFFFWAVGSH